MYSPCFPILLLLLFDYIFVTDGPHIQGRSLKIISPSDVVAILACASILCSHSDETA
jgi:hypothetical protein